MSTELDKKVLSNHKNAVGAYFSTQTDTWRDFYRLNGEGKDGLLKLEVIKRKETVLYLLDKYTFTKKLNIFDIGCGAGILAKEMLQRGHNVTGTDISIDMIREARKNTESAPSERKKFLLGDIESIAFADETFDCVTCVGVLEYQKDDRGGVTEISRVLREGGLAIITVPNLLRFRNLFDPYYYVKLLPRLTRKFYRQMKPGGPIDLVKAFEQNKSMANKKYYFGQLNKLFRIHHLDIVENVSIGFWPPTFWRRNLVPRSAVLEASMFFENWPSEGRFPFLKWFANRWVICLRKKQV